MECYKIENLSFTYPNQEKCALKNIDLTIQAGEFITLCGPSGCGKSTLLRLLKPALALYGEKTGAIFFAEKPLEDWDKRAQAAKIGFVLQSVDNQIVTDKVWHELAFGLESLGLKNEEIRAKVAEMATFFGISNWFHKSVSELSGGQKQLLNLASVMVMEPEVLLLDEPTSQLDPIAAAEFLQMLAKINHELGTTIILAEHRMEEALALADRAIVLDRGEIIACDTPKKVGACLKNNAHEFWQAMPVPMRIYAAVKNDLSCPLTVREGKDWLEAYAQTHELYPELIPEAADFESAAEAVVEMKEVWFRYEKDAPDILKGVSLCLHRGEFFALLGANGTGKTTVLKALGAIVRPYRGEIVINGENINEADDLYQKIALLPQNPQSLFTKKTVALDLSEALREEKLTQAEKIARINEIAELCQITELLARHPYDLSGGEQQRAALAKVLLKKPRVLLMDEPTKGIDAVFKEKFAEIIAALKMRGVAIMMVSHDIEFCAEYADRCALFFDGNIASQASAREFFSGKNFYTTAANRLARKLLPNAVLAEDVILACGGQVIAKKTPKVLTVENWAAEKPAPEHKSPKRRRVFAGIFFLALFGLCLGAPSENFAGLLPLKEILSLVFTMLAGICLWPQKELDIKVRQKPREERALDKRTVMAAFMILMAIPYTIFFGIYYLDDRKYYFISLLIILETMLPFIMVFEKRKPQARELVLISALCALAVAGRAAFFMLPQFKPVAALVIIAGVCFGGETGFLVGAVTAFVSNFFFGQGPWTPWQMFAFGSVGFLAGVLFQKGWLRKTKASLCVFGFLATFVIYGCIMNTSYVIQSQTHLTKAMFIAALVSGAPFDLVHAVSTVFFLWIMAEAMIEKLERIKEKYGLLE